MLFVALLAIALLLFITNPELLEDIWLWIIGFIGYIILIIEKGVKSISRVFSSKVNDKQFSRIPHQSQTLASEKTGKALEEPLAQKIERIEQHLRNEPTTESNLDNTTLTVLRYLDDGETSLGLLFLRDKFFAYTLEDTFRAEKVKSKTRVPSGSYNLAFYEQDTDLTRKYRINRPWFKYHLEIKGIPNFQNVYIHIGNTHQDTAGCLLIADGVHAYGPEKMILQSRIAFERFYKTISALLQSGEKVTIRILNEDWFEHAKLQPV